MSSYEVRAIKFIRQFAPFIADCKRVSEYNMAVNRFNKAYNRKVKCDNGMTRIVFITSDYVIKIDYSQENICKWGGCDSEVAFYNLAVKEGYGYLFAKSKPYYHNGRVFYIMPRIHGIGREFEDADEYMTADECDWCWSHCLRDLHRYNYGWKDGHVVIFDYSANEYMES